MGEECGWTLCARCSHCVSLPLWHTVNDPLVSVLVCVSSLGCASGTVYVVLSQARHHMSVHPCGLLPPDIYAHVCTHERVHFFQSMCLSKVNTSMLVDSPHSVIFTSSIQPHKLCVCTTLNVCVYTCSHFQSGCSTCGLMKFCLLGAS